MDSKVQVAIKMMNLINQPNRDLIISEIRTMKKLQHKNIINYLDSCLHPTEKELWVVMDYLDGGALTDVVTETVMETRMIAAVTRECLEAIQYLHGKNIIHRLVCPLSDDQHHASRWSNLLGCYVAR